MVLQKSIVKHLGYVKTIELHEYLLSGSIMIAHNEVITLIIVLPGLHISNNLRQNLPSGYIFELMIISSLSISSLILGFLKGY